jgi:hypothetical protein
MTVSGLFTSNGKTDISGKVNVQNHIMYGLKIPAEITSVFPRARDMA